MLCFNIRKKSEHKQNKMRLLQSYLINMEERSIYKFLKKSNNTLEIGI